MNPDSFLPTRPDPLALLDGLLDPFFAVDGQWRLTYLNRHAAASVGMTPEELLGREFWSCFPEALETALNTEYRFVMEARQGRQFDLFSPSLGVWVEVRAFPHEDGIAVHFRDITERRHTEDCREALLAVTRALVSASSTETAIRTALALGREALGAAGGALWRLSRDQTRLDLWQRVGTGTGPETSLPVEGPSPVTAALHQPDGVFVGARGGHTSSGVLAACRLGDSGVLALHFGRERRLSESERDFVRSLAAQLRQTLERLQAAEVHEQALAALHQERTRLAAILDQLPAAVWIAEMPGGRITAGNRAIERILRHPYRPSADIGQYSEYVGFHPDGRRYQGHEWPLARTVLTGERVENEEIEMERGDGSRGFVQYSSALIQEGLNPAGPGLAVVTGVDVSELRELSATLEQRVETRTHELRRRNEELAAETAALQTFARFTELVSRETDLNVLTQAAAGVLHRALGEGSTGYYERHGDLWKQGPWDGDMDPGTLTAAQAGFPADLPLFAGPATSREPLFVDEWRASDHLLAPHTPEYGAIAVYPVTVQGRTAGLLAAGLREKTGWNERDRAVFRAVGRALSLAAERADLTRALSVQKEELAARNRALETFAELGRDPGLCADPLELVRRALALLLTQLPAGYALYGEPEDGLWRCKAQAGVLPSAESQAAMDAGLPFEATPLLFLPWQTRQPLYPEGPDSGVPEGPLTPGTRAATLPVLVGGTPCGVLVVALPEPGGEQRAWTGTERVILETAVQQLGLALERWRGEQALAAKQRQLEQANHDLEAFASSVSHDLRAPVRHLGSFAGLLRRAVPDNPRALKYLDVIEQSAARMNALIDGLLTFARLGSGEVRKSDVALGELMDAVRAELAPQVGERQIDWRVGELPVVRGDVTLLRQVIQNLLGNAVKYTGTRDRAVIEIWAETAGHEQVIHVRDNGVGFDPAYRDRLFEVFKRLHSAQEFEGEGVGLASVERIVTRHGGRVRAEGQVEGGATFTFTLPVQG
ncbi:multi-sensor signal transduction histidine kinase [Deinococcus phoenicis]|uniref:histidine kinase n=1 Tax=Deinococcus phoenicis TaxID=1476583 RepID=A0A016QTK4_9DEIO|nr:ATP-binding protein [Deinococcus phoenicis]EYB69099.1 multi-sensor signal transduction histidine kinase [Deinococcus phoenicis]